MCVHRSCPPVCFSCFPTCQSKCGRRYLLRLVETAVCCVQVAAYTSGKDSVSLLDCLLLEHILWQQPDQQARITDFLLSQISEDDGLQSADYILASE